MVAYDPVDDQFLPDRYVEGPAPTAVHARGDDVRRGVPAPPRTRRGRGPRIDDHRQPRRVPRAHPPVLRSLRVLRVPLRLPRSAGGDLERPEPAPRVDRAGAPRLVYHPRHGLGIDYPGENPQDLVLYVWVDAPIEYISSTKQYTERVGADAFDWEAAWKEGASDAHPEGGEIVHVIGRDIIQHHTIFWPAMLEATDHTEPRAVMASGFVTPRRQGLLHEPRPRGLGRRVPRRGVPSRPAALLPRDQRRVPAGRGLLVGEVPRPRQHRAGGDRRQLPLPLAALRPPQLRRRAHRGRDERRGRRADRGGDRRPTSRPPSTTTPCARSATPSPTSPGSATSTSSAASRGSSWTTTPEAAQVIHDCVAIAKAIAVLFEPIAPEKTERLWDQLGEDGSVHETTVEAAREGPPATTSRSRRSCSSRSKTSASRRSTKAGGARAAEAEDGDEARRGETATTARRTTTATKRTTTPLTNPT